MKTVAGMAPLQTALEPPAGEAGKRLLREWQTVAVMIHCYCRGHHAATGGLCEGCRDLLGYATIRLQRCRFGLEKPTCANCPVHCYQRQRREQVRAVMRYAGPRMLWEHPILAVRHWLDGRRRAPVVTRTTG
jgi:Nitrous oxide-stimulated promoter